MVDIVLAAPVESTIELETQPTQGQWTYDDYLRLPDDGQRYEIIEGVLYVANAPSFEHQYLVSSILRLLGNFVAAEKLGVVLTAPFEVHLSEESRPVQPDVLFIPQAEQAKMGQQVFQGAPALVVEVLSPSSTRTDRLVKFAAYERAGVQEYWIANPKTNSLEIYTLAQGVFALHGEFTAAEAVESPLLKGLSFAPMAVFWSPLEVEVVAENTAD